MSSDDTASPDDGPGPEGLLPSLAGEPDRTPSLRVVEPAGASSPARVARLPIEALGEVELKVEVILGRARLRLQDLLDVRPGQAVELDRTRNSPVDVLVNGTLFARGEIVVIDDTNLGVRVSEVVGAELKEAEA
ncbi:MAG: FliM/FliN family flagellar motor switch protein [Actinomycetota bacterium]|nr:FliM/FliN family flagellar motor switch protein [Actinomycetota bacterium]